MVAVHVNPDCICVIVKLFVAFFVVVVDPDLHVGLLVRVLAALCDALPGCGVSGYRCNVPRALHLLARGHYNPNALSTAVRVEIFPAGKNTTRPFTTLWDCDIAAESIL